MDSIEELRKKMIDAAKRGVQEKFEGADVHIIKSVNILEDLDPIANLLIEQLREWHSVHFPELNDLVKDNDSYLKLVAKIGDRGGFNPDNVSKNMDDKELSDAIARAAGASMGSVVSGKDMEEMKSLALNCLNLRQQRDYLAAYLEDTMKREMPNFSELAGAVIGAKILAKVGGKKKLAFLAASAIQMVGAEKALFAHFKTGVKGPKYGYLYQHPLVKSTPQENKGKMARSLAAKLAIAARKDFFGNTSNADDLKKKLDERSASLGSAHEKNYDAPQRGEMGRPEIFRAERKPQPRKEFAVKSERQLGREGGHGNSGYGEGGHARREGGHARQDSHGEAIQPFDMDAARFSPRRGQRGRGSFGGGRKPFRAREGGRRAEDTPFRPSHGGFSKPKFAPRNGPGHRTWSEKTPRREGAGEGRPFRPFNREGGFGNRNRPRGEGAGAFSRPREGGYGSRGYGEGRPPRREGGFGRGAERDRPRTGGFGKPFRRKGSDSGFGSGERSGGFRGNKRRGFGKEKGGPAHKGGKPWVSKSRK